MFFNIIAGTVLSDPHPTTHLKIGLSHAFQERFYSHCLVVSGKLKEPSFDFIQRMPCR